MWNKKFQFTLVASESEEMFKEWGTENFSPSVKEFIAEGVVDIDDAVEIFKLKCISFSNGDWDWECNRECNYGEIRFGNDVDGLALIYKIEEVG